MLEALLARAADPDGVPPDVVHCLTYRKNDATGRFAPPWRLLMYAKTVQDNMTTAQLRVLRHLGEEEFR
jgi:hypothetical protein